MTIEAYKRKVESLLIDILNTRSLKEAKGKASEFLNEDLTLEYSPKDRKIDYFVVSVIAFACV